MLIVFQKMNVNGDDFVIVDLCGWKYDCVYFVDGDFVWCMGDWYCGIGFNQFVVILDGDDVVVCVVFWNFDGLVFDICGSVMCGVVWKLMWEIDVVLIVLCMNCGCLYCLQDVDGLIKVEMGVLWFGWQDIFFVEVVDMFVLLLLGMLVVCSMGNLYCMFFVDDFDMFDVVVFGLVIEVYLLFLQKINVYFVWVIDCMYICLCIWECGGGVLFGFGLCLCGVVVNGIWCGLFDDIVWVICDGGDVVVYWDGVGSVFLSGFVMVGFSGVWLL